MTVVTPNAQPFDPVPPLQEEPNPQSTFPECTTSLQVQLETAHFSYVGEPPPSYPASLEASTV